MKKSRDEVCLLIQKITDRLSHSYGKYPRKADFRMVLSRVYLQLLPHICERGEKLSKEDMDFVRGITRIFYEDWY